MTRDALEGKGPQRPPQKRSGRRLEEVAKAVGGGYCRLRMPLRLAVAVRRTVAGHRLGSLEGSRGSPPPLPMQPRSPGAPEQAPAGVLVGVQSPALPCFASGGWKIDMIVLGAGWRWGVSHRPDLYHRRRRAHGCSFTRTDVYHCWTVQEPFLFFLTEDRLTLSVAEFG